MTGNEYPLAGGRTTPGVVRVGQTVRRPQRAQSGFVHLLLQNLAERQFTAAPQFLGIDDAGREILSFLPGDVPADLGEFSTKQLRAAARLLRAFHDATAEMSLRDRSEIVCHGDPSPCNAVFQDGLPYAWIDYDCAHPGSRIEDVGYAAWLWLDIGNDDWKPEVQLQRLTEFFTDYGRIPSCNPINAVMSAQETLCTRTDAPEGNKEWALDCHAWTVAHLLPIGGRFR